MHPAFLLLAENPLSVSPRAYRLSLALLALYPHTPLFVLSPPPCPLSPSVTFLSFPPLDKSLLKTQKITDCIAKKHFSPLLFTPNRLELARQLNQLEARLERQKIYLKAVFVQDLALLPTLVEHTRLQNLIVDLREFYPALVNPQHFSAPLFHHICTHYLSYAHKSLSVNASIAKLYAQNYPHFNPAHNLIWHSTPFYANLRPSPLSSPIRLLYHGLIAKERDSHNLLDLAQNLKDLPLPYHLSLMVLSKHPTFFQDFKARATRMQAQGVPIKLLKPVGFLEIIPASQPFDLGLLSLPNNSLNHLYALPNKFFEYIQSALGVISTPLMEVKSLLEAHQMGITSLDFSHASLLETLAGLNMDQIRHYKQQASQAAKVLCMQAQLPKLARFLGDL
ncbi:capsular biosynthesis protein [Helicobacter mehlei]|uniref:Capsular biosynthesis protein n=1 Tax=Helicobacter mehlei TaxID=2316080 RepID=A0A553V0K5_9HELI|nr:capsular biosynthesis protein [Helicobacter mehlei]TSA85997.1 capsular biosynthesis protein [Helicobacter mehlei]